LLRRLKALNDKLKKQNQGHVRRVKALNDKLKKQNQAHVRALIQATQKYHQDAKLIVLYKLSQTI
jgi:hypothetical protein